MALKIVSFSSILTVRSIPESMRVRDMSPKEALAMVLVSMVSLSGGVSLGTGTGLVCIGCGAATFVQNYILQETTENLQKNSFLSSMGAVLERLYGLSDLICIVNCRTSRTRFGWIPCIIHLRDHIFGGLFYRYEFFRSWNASLAYPYVSEVSVLSLSLLVCLGIWLRWRPALVDSVWITKHLSILISVISISGIKDKNSTIGGILIPIIIGVVLGCFANCKHRWKTTATLNYASPRPEGWCGLFVLIDYS